METRRGMLVLYASVTFDPFSSSPSKTNATLNASSFPTSCISLTA